MRFLTQWRGCDSCPGPLLMGGCQLCPLKPEPRHSAAEPGKETPIPLSLQPGAVGQAVLTGALVGLAGASWP